MSSAAVLRRRLDSKPLLMAPGVFDCVSARVVEEAGFEAMYLTGHGVSNSAIGESDIGLLSFGELAARARDVIGSVAIPVIVDTDTGYGGPLNVQRTVRQMETMGAAAIQLEDQTWPKYCGHMPGKSLISDEAMVQKLRAAQDARVGELVLIARTDALAVEGFEGAIRRAKLYADAGADLVFIDALGDEEECRRAVAAVDAPVLANMVEGSRTAYLSAAELEQVGFSAGIWPLSMLLNAITAMRSAAAELKSSGRLEGHSLTHTMDFPAFLNFWDFETVRELNGKYAHD